MLGRGGEPSDRCGGTGGDQPGDEGGEGRADQAEQDQQAADTGHGFVDLIQVPCDLDRPALDRGGHHPIVVAVQAVGVVFDRAPLLGRDLEVGVGDREDEVAERVEGGAVGADDLGDGIELDGKAARAASTGIDRFEAAPSEVAVGDLAHPLLEELVDLLTQDDSGRRPRADGDGDHRHGHGQPHRQGQPESEAHGWRTV